MVKKIGMVIVGATLVVAHCLIGGEAFADSYTQDGKPCPPECVSDSMEIITYYPSPYGYYEELRGDKIIVGDTDNSHINETDLPPSGTITFEPLLDDPDASDGSLYEGSLYYQGAIGGTKGKFRFYDGFDWQDLGGGGDFWKPSTASGGTNDIYYTQSGNVGIGLGESDTIGAKLQINTSSSAPGLVVKSAVGTAVSLTFEYTGGSQTYKVPVGVTQITITAYGAQGSNGIGGANSPGDGGSGGKAEATISVTPTEVLNVYVGGQGGYNGGGNGAAGASSGGTGGNGGGASEVRRGITKLIVAGGGGGGGGGGYYMVAGSGGDGGGNDGVMGGNGYCGAGAGGGGGTQNVGGFAGNSGASEGTSGNGGTGGGGGSTGSGGGGGGGGGHYGGGGGGGRCGGGGAGGGGGSGYVTGTNTSMTSGGRSGNGIVIIAPAGIKNITEWQNTSGTVLGVVTAGGQVGIGTANPNYTLTVNGTAWITSGSWTGSDLRWKKNIKPLANDAIDRLINLNTISYYYNDEMFRNVHFPSGRQIGLIAQEVEKEFPELVHTDINGYKAVAYDKLTAVLVEAVKEQQAQMRNQQKKIEILELKLKELAEKR